MANKPLATTSIESSLSASSGIPGLTFEVKPSMNDKREVNRLAVEAQAAIGGGDSKATLTPGTKSAVLKFKTFNPPKTISWTVRLTADFDKEVLKAVANGDAGETNYLFDGNIATWASADVT